MTFHSPTAFFLLLLLPLFLGRPKFLVLSPRRAQPTIPFSSPLPVSELSALARRTSWKVRLKAKLPILAAISFVFLIIALARPQRASTVQEIEWSGRDILFALDISGSMQALDFFIDGDRVDRLTALKHVMKKFVQSRAGDRMAMVIFGDRVFTQCPLTMDSGAIQSFIDRLEVGMAGQGTAIGDGLGISIKRLADIPAKSKTIVLVTDGKNNSGTLRPFQAANIAKSLGIKVHVIGIGGEGTAPFPVQGPFGLTATMPRDMEYDEATLQEIAKVTGGKYFNAKDSERLLEISREIDSLESRSDRVRQQVSYEEYFFYFLTAGALLWALVACAEKSFLLTVPES
jgi:Ca-activated chloride channel homolog